jgi:hypothetical protein
MAAGPRYIASERTAHKTPLPLMRAVSLLEKQRVRRTVSWQRPLFDSTVLALSICATLLCYTLSVSCGIPDEHDVRGGGASTPHHLNESDRYH